VQSEVTQQIVAGFVGAGLYAIDDIGGGWSLFFEVAPNHGREFLERVER
jgi:hypothetical protein